MNRIQLEHIIRAASAIADDPEIVIIGSQAIHAQNQSLPAVAYLSHEADVFPKHHPERADLIEGSIGEHSTFHDTFGYYAQGVSPTTAILPIGWEDRLVVLKNENTGSGIGLCLEIHDLVLSKFAAGREKDHLFTREMIRYHLVDETTLLSRLTTMPLKETSRQIITAKIHRYFKELT